MPKTIDDIIPPSRRRQMTAENAPEMPPPPPTDESPAFPPMPPKPPRMRINTGRSFPFGTALIALIVVVVCAGVLYAFSNAKVEIVPRTQNVSVSGDFTATAGSGDLPFSVVTVSKTATKTVRAESTETANDSAQGSITVYNTQSKPQNLINNTRFESASGLIYRVHTPITVPAATASGPGSVTVTVYADQPGEKYNIGPTTFTVPGLKGSAIYNDISAKSTGAMAGGFSGTRASVGQATDDATHAALQAALSTSLQTALTEKVPSGSILLPGASTVNYQAVPDTATSTSNVTISEQGTATAVVFPEGALAKAIAYKVVGTYSGEPVTLANVSNLKLTPAASSTDLSSAQTYDFTLSGSATVVWKVDSAKIAGAVAGKTRDSAQSILSGFPEVDRAILILRPFWTSTFPQDPSHIKVIVDQPKSGS